MLAVVNAVLVMEDHYIPNACILTDGEKIVDFGQNIQIPESAECVDAMGNFVGPGLVDIHIHSAGKYSFVNEPEKCFRYLMSHGVTSVLPTLYFSLCKNGYIEAIEQIRQSAASGMLANFCGFYMEGPYLNPSYGASRENNYWAKAGNASDYEPVVKAAGKDVRVWALAPERKVVTDFIRCAKSENENVVFAVGHSEATAQEVEKLLDRGLCIATHHTNATGSPVSRPGCAASGVEEAVNFNDSIYAELICDSMGIHVSPYMLRFVTKIKGKDKIILISDCDIEDGVPPKQYEGVQDLVFDRSGNIAGTCLTLDKACTNMMIHTGCSICDCFKYASTNPSKAVGFTDMGKIAIENAANLIIVDEWFRVKNTIFKGVLQSSDLKNV